MSVYKNLVKNYDVFFGFAPVDIYFPLQIIQKYINT